MSFFDRLFGGAAPASPPPEPTGDAAAVRELLRVVRDPELDMDIVTLGLVRGIVLDGEVARVRMTLTTAGCPYGATLLEETERVLLDAGWAPDVQLEFDPPWSPADITR
jgi:metal-sulfur cluster biosynthetic enzyme